MTLGIARPYASLSRRVVLRKLLMAAFAAAALAVAPGTAAQPKLLMPGVTYEKQVQFTFHGPVVLHVLTAPRPGGLWSLRPVLSNGAIAGTERLTSIQKRLSPGATVAGVNGDRFAADGRPTGILMRAGALEHAPAQRRTSIGIDSTGSLRVGRVKLLATWRGTGQLRPLAAVNDAPGSGRVSLYTAAWGPATPTASGSYEVVLRLLAGTAPGAEVVASVMQLGTPGGGTPIPANGAVLVGRGGSVARLQTEAPVGSQVTLRLLLQPDWTGVVDALGGGPVLVRNGRAVFNAGEAFTSEQLALHEPRTAVGQLADGRVVLVAVDGGAPGYSTGMSNFELALALTRLGAVTAAALDSAGSTAMAFEGQLLSKPSGSERRLSEALVVAYAGIQASPPAVPVLSPNGDGVADTQALAYKVVRPSAVNVSLVGPDGAARYSFTGSVQPGVYPIEWSGRTADGLPEPEGTWRWTLSATDDLGRASSFERRFGLNLTLGFPKTVGPALPVPRKRPRAVAAFELTRPATVTIRIETAGGALVRTLVKRGEAAAGTLIVSWDGVTDRGGKAGSGRYAVRVTAANEEGSVSLVAPFAVRRTLA